MVRLGCDFNQGHPENESEALLTWLSFVRNLFWALKSYYQTEIVV
jgi:hypothetical protein